MEVKSKVWFEKGGSLAFGIGKCRILKEIAMTGSINKAARNLDMSYRHAWSYVSSAEKRLGEPLLLKVKGGQKGGGAVLTNHAKDLIKKFEKLDKDVREFTNKRFEEIF